MLLTEINNDQTPLSIFVNSCYGEVRPKPLSLEQMLKRWINDLGNELMWIGMLDDRGKLRCLPNHDRDEEEIRGWRELPSLLELIPGLLNTACPVEEGNVILRSAAALYIALCLKGRPVLVLGLEPSISLAQLGFV